MRKYLADLRHKDVDGNSRIRELTQADAAKACGIHRTSYNDLEHGGRSKVSLSCAHGLSKLFGVSVDYLADCEVEYLKKV